MVAQPKTLEDILRLSTEPLSQQEFRLIAIRHRTADDLTFYIHPLGKDGDTGDFKVDGDYVFPYPWSATQDPSKDGLDWTEILPDTP